MNGTNVRKGVRASLVLGLSVVAAACHTAPVVTDAAGSGGGGGGGPGGGDFGATQGGVQDMGLARELVHNGKVPPAEAFVVEGMFSEHDLGLQGEPCQTLLCLRAALGVAPDASGVESGWLQVGMSSTIDPSTYQRPSVTLIATVDVSGSMGWSYQTDHEEYPTPAGVSSRLLRDITSALTPDDHVAIVTYGSGARTALGLTSAGEQEQIQAAINGLHTDGSTNMEAGLRLAFGLARDARQSIGGEVRVLLFTDVQPNVGASTPTEFETLVSEAAGDGVSLTVFGVGVGLGQEVLYAMVSLRGGNAFALFDYEDVAELMQDDWPYFLSPIAYDLAVTLSTQENLAVAEAYGFPGDQDAEAIGFNVSTVFLSRRKGALLVKLIDPQGAGIAALNVAGDLQYDRGDGERMQQSITPSYGGEAKDEGGRHFQQVSVGETVALALLVSGMAEAAKVYRESQEQAVVTMTATLERFESDVEALGDTAIAVEVGFAEALLSLMSAGASQGDLYGLY
jgi:Ca-activated chloride channel family protein